MQLKGIIKNMAAKTGIKANALLQNYMLERLLERISVSEYKWKFILKGGMLISAIVGLDSRTTMDMDVTIKGVDFSKENLLSIFERILKIPIPDDVKFILKGIEEIKEDKTIQGIWKAYTKRFVYANDIAFEDSIAALIKLFEMYSK